jgi:hypothetical protein
MRTSDYAAGIIRTSTANGPIVEIVKLDAKPYDQIREVVGGWLECVTLPDATMYLNEEGKLLGLPINHLATEIAHRDGAIAMHDCICGNVFMVGLPDENGDDLGLPPYWATALMAFTEINNV